MCQPSMSPTAKLTEECLADNQQRNGTAAIAEIESGTGPKTSQQQCSDRETNSKIRVLVYRFIVRNENSPVNGTYKPNK